MWPSIQEIGKEFCMELPKVLFRNGVKGRDIVIFRMHHTNGESHSIVLFVKAIQGEMFPFNETLTCSCCGMSVQLLKHHIVSPECVL